MPIFDRTKPELEPTVPIVEASDTHTQAEYADAPRHPADLEDGLHDTHHPATQDDVGKMARLVLTDGTVHATGRIVAYTDAPTVDLRDASGNGHHWRADLTSVIEDQPIKVNRDLIEDIRTAKNPTERRAAVENLLLATKDA